jgi:hypothetical protein
MLFAVSIKDYLIVCISAAMISRFKVKPLYKANTEIINEDVKWNRMDKVYIEEIIKIKMS